MRCAKFETGRPTPLYSSSVSRLLALPGISASPHGHSHQSLRTGHAQIKDNIALGNPNHATDLDLIKEAARLGGADSVVRRLPDEWNTYINRPDSVHDVIRIQHKDDDGALDRALRKMTGTQMPQGLSGGQQQRIAV